MFKSKDHVKKFLNYMNSRHPNIRFTCEEEHENNISFLDISINKNKSKLTTSVFRKKTFSGVYLNFNSYLPTEYKKGLILTLLYRTYMICSDYSNLHKEIVYLKTVWLKNAFPLFFIDKCVKKFFDNSFITRKKKDCSREKEVIISLEYLGKISLQVKKQLTDIFRSCHKEVKLMVVFKSSNRISNAFRFKDQLPLSLNSLVTYKFTCGTCNSAYIGKTKRHLLVRQYEHLGLSLFTEKPLRYNEKDATSIRKHCHEHGHINNADNFKIMGNSINNYHLQLKESLLILKLKPLLNKAKESMPLYLFNEDV